jgi:limonene-1,2-epoxide hydrolase
MSTPAERIGSGQPSGPMDAPTSERPQAHSIVMCSQAVMRFYAALDTGDIDGVAALMAADGVWHRQGKALRGPAEVLAALRERPPGRVTAHLVNNLVIDLDASGQQATARYMLLVFRHDRAQPGDGPVPIASSLLSITATTDHWRAAPNGDWLAVLKQGQTVFSQQV